MRNAIKRHFVLQFKLNSKVQREGESEKRRARQDRIELQSASVSSNLIAFSFRFFTATSIISERQE